jgi:flagellar motor switch protein FliG
VPHTTTQHPTGRDANSLTYNKIVSILFLMHSPSATANVIGNRPHPTQRILLPTTPRNEQTFTEQKGGCRMTENRVFLASLLAMYLSKENPNNIAVILSQLDPLLAANILTRLPDEMQTDEMLAEVIFYLAAMSSKEVKEGISLEIKTILLDTMLNDEGGPEVAGDILNRVGRTTEKCVLDRLDARDPEVAEEVRNTMFTFDDIANLTDEAIQLILREVDTKHLVIALKGGSKELKERIFSNVSEEVGSKIKEEMDSVGPKRMSDVEDLQLRIVQTARLLEEKGQIKIDRQTFSGRLSHWRHTENIFL